MNIEIVAGAAISSGDYEGMSIGNESHMANETFIENLVSLGAIVHSALRFAHQSGAWCRSLVVRHDLEEAPGNREELQASVAERLVPKDLEREAGQDPPYPDSRSARQPRRDQLPRASVSIPGSNRLPISRCSSTSFSSPTNRTS